MNQKIRIGIIGYGNLGKGVELALTQNEDMELIGVFSRRDPASLTLVSPSATAYPLADLGEFKEYIDVMILCGGSKDDLPVQGPEVAEFFTMVDSFDTHARIPTYFEDVNLMAKVGGNTAIISVGWDPGLFSLNRLYGEAVLPQGETYTFWGKGLSQGHSDAIRRVPGVTAGVQYTLPIQDAIDQVRNGSNPQLSTREKHRRDCYVVLADGADAAAVERAIVTMPDYFADYDTNCNFITAEELQQDHSAMPHGGFVIRSGKTGLGTDQVMEYSLTLASNPEFTASVLVAYARAAFKMNAVGEIGAKTVFDVAPGLLSPKSAPQLREEML
ncbi:MAG: diaminopimelate dehydrogenase [Verrucomicrobiales bacterium]|jgi:diaminopimelate dehydrogenase|nr:diaminopimelate dehydrogenase [Verrucomicrobiales bacterium]